MSVTSECVRDVHVSKGSEACTEQPVTSTLGNARTLSNTALLVGTLNGTQPREVRGAPLYPLSALARNRLSDPDVTTS